MVGCDDGYRSRKCNRKQKEGSGQEGAIDMFSLKHRLDECSTSMKYHVSPVRSCFFDQLSLYIFLSKTQLELKGENLALSVKPGGLGRLDCGKIS
jgi:hypothetical protein